MKMAEAAHGINGRKSIYLTATNPKEIELLTAIVGGGLWRDDKSKELVLRFVVSKNLSLDEVQQVFHDCSIS